MPNPLTGDFEAVLQVSGSTVNRLLATMHQNGGSNPALPSFPHSFSLRIGDPDAIDGMRGTARAQLSVPRIELIHGATDRFWLEVHVRARYTADPGTVPIPEFINGTVRAQYRIDSIDPDCRGWEKLAADYMWIRVVRDTVSFTGTAVDDTNVFSVASAVVSAADADARITRVARVLLAKKFEATPHKVSRRFRRGSLISLASGPRSAVAVPIALSGDPSAGNITSITQDFLDGRDVGIAIDRNVILGKVQRELDLMKARYSIGFRFYHKTHADLGFLGGIDVLTVTIDYTVKLTSANAQWIGGIPPVLGMTVPGGIIAINLTGQARTQKSIFNFDFNVTQLVVLSFDASAEKFVAASFGAATVKLSGTLASVIEGDAKPFIQAEIATVVGDAANGVAGSFSLAARKKDLVEQLETLDGNAGIRFDQASFSADGVVVRGRIGLTARSRPVTTHAITADKNGYTAFGSWIPGGRIDSFGWSWKWFNKAGSPGSANITDRFVLRRPAATGKGKFGMAIGIKEPLPGLDGMGQVCLVVDGVHVHPVTGDLVPVSVVRKCKRFGFEVRIAGVDRVFLREWVPGPRDPIGPVAVTGVHEVSGRNVRGHGANTLVVRIGRGWDDRVAGSIRDGLANSQRRDAGLVVLVLFDDGSIERSGGEWISQANELAAELEAPLIVNEDVQGSWSNALRMRFQEGSGHDVEWRLISPTGGVTWARSGPMEPRDLTAALDDYLFPSPIPRPANVMRPLPIGARISAAAFESGVSAWLNEREEACPPPPFGRLGIETNVTFVGKGSTAAEAALGKLSAASERDSDDTFTAVVVDGATAEDIERLRSSLPQGVALIPDPDGSIAGRFRVRTWPSRISISEQGVVSGFDFEADDSPAQPPSRDAS